MCGKHINYHECVMCSYFGVITTKRLGKWTLLDICLNKLAMYSAWDVCDTCSQQVCIKQSWSPVNIEFQRVCFSYLKLHCTGHFMN